MKISRRLTPLLPALGFLFILPAGGAQPSLPKAPDSGVAAKNVEAAQQAADKAARAKAGRQTSETDVQAIPTAMDDSSG